jgi:hypothetical protein
MLLVAAGAQAAPVTPIPEDEGRIAVRSWLVSGMFPSPPLDEPNRLGPFRVGHDTDFLTKLGGEANARITADTTVPIPETGEPVAFTSHTWESDHLNLIDIFGDQAGVCVYLYAELESLIDQTVYVHVGTNDSGKAWAGGRQIFESTLDVAATRSQGVGRVDLTKGRTPILVKVDQAGNAWGAYVDVYGATAHAAFTAANFPSKLRLTADNDLPYPGDTIEVQVLSNPAWPEAQGAISWRLKENGTTRALESGSPVQRMVVAGPPREIVLHATRNILGREVHGAYRIHVGERAEETFVSERFPRKVVVTLGDDFAAERVLHWRTQPPASEPLIHMPKEHLGEIETKRLTDHQGPYLQHRVSLKDLEPGHTYSVLVTDGENSVFPPAVSVRMEHEPATVELRTVYHEEGRFAAWPANQGAWSWGNEIVLGFTQSHLAKRTRERQHLIDTSKGAQATQARSLDGGETWTLVKMPLPPNSQLGDCPGGLDFTHADFALKATANRFYVSFDRCQTWEGPYRLPYADILPLKSRTDYQVLGKHDLVLMLTTDKPSGHEGRAFSVRTQDGGKTWSHISWIGPEPKRFSIMPSSVRLESGRILVALRHMENVGDSTDTVIDLYASDDNGFSWQYVTTPVPHLRTGGNPPAMLRLTDGRVCITYGHREDPVSIRAIFSEDDGASWGQETILRCCAGDQDIGYPRSVLRPDGKVVTMYYFNDTRDGERYIEATIWKPQERMQPRVTAKR